MYNLAQVKQWLELGTNFPVKWLFDRTTLLQQVKIYPAIFLGFSGVKPQSQDDGQVHDMLGTRSENLTQYFEVHLVTTHEFFSEQWLQIFRIINGTHPIVEESQYSAINYVEGGVLGSDSQKIWWVDQWKIAFPMASYFD